MVWKGARPRIVVVGSMNMDLVVRAANIPAPGETVLGDACRQNPGGKGANQAVAAARLDADVAMVARVGDDAFGKVLRTALARERVDVDPVKMTPDISSGVALIVVDAGGQNAICVAPGANARLTPDDVRKAEPLIRRADALLVQFETPMETVAEALRIARQAGLLTLVDPAPACQAPDDVLAADMLTPNAAEASGLTGVDVVDPPSALDAGRRLLARGAAGVAVKLGADGCVWVEAGKEEIVPAFPVQVVDTTAAGDAFAAALAVARVRGEDISRALRVASAAGALTCTRPGAQPSLPTASEVSAFLRCG